MYAKLFASLYRGTLRGNAHAILVFTNLLANADARGHADVHPRAIADDVGLTVDEVRAALDYLEAPDPDSRSPEHDGKRLLRLDLHRNWGWQIVNHAKYRAIRNEEDRREQNRLAQERWRKQSKQSKPPSAGDKQASAQSAQAEAEAEAEVIPPPASTESPMPSASTTPPKPTAAASTPTWIAYSETYRQRYGVDPVRNKTVNTRLKAFVERVGADSAPGVAAFYVRHNRQLYVASKHCVDLLLRDAEGLHTDWQRGQQTTDADARAVDRGQTNLNAFAPLIAEARAREAAERDLANG